MEEELDRMSAKVDEMHAILLRARGVRWAIIAVSGLVGFLAGIAHWVVARSVSCGFCDDGCGIASA
jgi:hypothetical protein